MYGCVCLECLRGHCGAYSVVMNTVYLPYDMRSMLHLVNAWIAMLTRIIFICPYISRDKYCRPCAV